MQHTLYLVSLLECIFQENNNQKTAKTKMVWVGVVVNNLTTCLQLFIILM